jgi:hypothetical protein
MWAIRKYSQSRAKMWAHFFFAQDGQPTGDGQQFFPRRDLAREKSGKPLENPAQTLPVLDPTTNPYWFNFASRKFDA